MNHPINIKGSLKTLCIFCVGICFSAKSRVSTPKRAVEGLAMVCVNFAILDILNGVGMFRMWSLIPGALRASFVRLGAFVLQPDLDSSSERLAWAASFAGSD